MDSIKIDSIGLVGLQFRGMAFLFMNIITLGVFYVVCRLCPTFYLNWMFEQAPLELAEYVLLEDQYKNKKLIEVKEMRVKMSTLGLNRYIMEKKDDGYGKFKNGKFFRIIDTPYSRFIYDFKLSKFVSPNFQQFNKYNLADLQYMYDAPEETANIYEKEVIFGLNEIPKEPVTLLTIIDAHIFDIFFIWEVVSFCVWISIAYYTYAIVTGLIFLTSFIKSVRAEYLMVAVENEAETGVKCWRGRKFVEIQPRMILPGDIIQIEKTDMFECDCIILKGDVISDEAFLTGETVPICKGTGDLVYAGTKVIKSSSDDTALSGDGGTNRIQKLVKVKSLTCKKSGDTFGGTKMAHSTDMGETNYTCKQPAPALGLVLKTGRKTKRGTLLKNMQVRKTPFSRFSNQSNRIVRTLLGGSAIVMILFMFYLGQYLSLATVCEFTFDLFLTLFSPSLYTCLNLGILYVKDELKLKHINTTDKDRIITAGEIDVVVFDKTGTLTEVGLDIDCVDGINGVFKDIGELVSEDTDNNIGFVNHTPLVNQRLTEPQLIGYGLSTCHNVLELDGQYSGDVLDMKMFLFAKCELFTSNKKRMIKMNIGNKSVIEDCREYKPNQEILQSENEDFTAYFSYGKHENVTVDGDQVGETNANKSAGNQSAFDEIEKSAPIVESEENLFFYPNNSFAKATNNNMIEITKIYDFNSYLKRMSVVAVINGKRYLFCKGAPEVVKKILKCVPDNYENKFKDHSITGKRVIALCYKEITDENESRESLESELIFLTFIVFANKLKQETANVMKELREADIRTFMCTGDNILTAISVAKECGMIPMDIPVLIPALLTNVGVETATKSFFSTPNQEYLDADWLCVADEEYVFDKVKMELYSEYDETTECDYVIACEGKEYNAFKNTSYHSLILNKGRIFARFDPGNKKELVEDLGSVTGGGSDKTTVAFCGDGANDAAALTAADVGLSLYDNESSYICSFNSVKLSSILELIKEGRSALSLSLAQFKYIFYSQLLAGFQMVSLLPYLYFPSDCMSLINDLLSCYFLGYSLSIFKCADFISRKKIRINLFRECRNVTIELVGVLVTYIISLLMLTSLRGADWVEEETDEIIIESKHSTLLFFVTQFLFIYKAFQFANYRGYRQPRSTNTKFIVILVCCLLLLAFLFVSNGRIEFVTNWMEYTSIENNEYLVLLACFTSSAIITFVGGLLI